MNIGIVTTWFERGGAYVSRQYRDILKRKHNVYIYARGGKTYAINDPLWDDKYVEWEKRGSSFRYPLDINLKNFKNWIVNNHLDTVFFNEQHWWAPVLLCNKLGIKVGSYVDYYTEDTIPFFLSYDFLICNTQHHYSVFNWHPQVFYVPWGTDLKTFSPKSYKLVSPDTVTFFHSCGFNPKRKGTDIVLQAFAKLSDIFSGSARLVIHSQVSITEFFPQMRKLIKTLENRGLLTCHEKNVSAPGLYHLGDVYLYPSRLDGIGLTISEALACGLPVITSDNPPMKEFINGSNGKLIKVSRLYYRADGYYWPQCMVDVDDLFKCMRSYIENMAGIREYKRAARMYAETNLDWSKNAKSCVVLFEKSSKRPIKEKLHIMKQIEEYDQKALSWKTLLYLRFPHIYTMLKLIQRYYKYVSH